MVTFDSPSREFCVSRRTNTNTPLQALVTLNDPVYFEAAVALAEKMKEAGKDPSGQIIKGYEMAFFEKPGEQTLAHLLELYHSVPKSVAKKVAFDENEETGPPEVDGAVVVANAIMNLDVFLNK